VSLIEAVTLDEFAHGRKLCLLQHSGLSLLQSGIHGELEFGRLMLPMVHDLVDLVGHVTWIRT
jgi:hypothetical protein